MNKWDKQTQSWYMWVLMQMLTSINVRLELENAEMNAKQEALAVGYANDQTCALRIEMLEIANQNQTMKHTMSMNVRRLETELDAADMKRDEIMREFRSNIRSEHDRYAECEHHLALEESQLRLQVVHNERSALAIDDIREQAFRRIII